MGERTNFVEEGQLGLRCLTMIWAIYVVEDAHLVHPALRRESGRVS